MVQLELQVTKGYGQHVTELQVSEGSRKTCIELLYDSYGNPSRIKAVGRVRVPIADLARLLIERDLSAMQTSEYKAIFHTMTSAGSSVPDTYNVPVPPGKIWKILAINFVCIKNGALTPLHSVSLINNGPTPLGPFPFNYHKGKFFPRGCRGFIENAYLYLKGVGGAVALVLSFREYPGGAEIFHVDYTLPINAAEEWKTISVVKWWNYETLFLKVSSLDTVSTVTYQDIGLPPDAYQADPATPEVYTTPALRHWFRLNLRGAIDQGVTLPYAYAQGHMPTGGALASQYGNFDIISDQLHLPMQPAQHGGVLTWQGEVYTVGSLDLGFSLATAGDYLRFVVLYEERSL